MESPQLGTGVAVKNAALRLKSWLLVHPTIVAVSAFVLAFILIEVPPPSRFVSFFMALLFGCAAYSLWQSWLRDVQAQIESRNAGLQLEQLVQERTRQLEAANAQLRAEMAERTQSEQDQDLMVNVLRLLNRGGDLHELIGEVLGLIKRSTGFDAVGLRLQQGNDFPYFQQQGFSDAFLMEETFLCAKGADGMPLRDSDGSTALECTCGLVLSGRTDPRKPCFTAGGSFWTNHSPEMLALPPQADPRINPRNRCIYGGYESVMLAPVHSRQQIIGLLQLNDSHPGRFTPERIRFFEVLANNIGLALQRRQIEEALRESESRFRTFFDTVAVGTAELDASGHFVQVNERLCQITGYSPEELLGMTIPDLMHPEDRDSDKEGLATHLRGDRPAYEIERRCVRKDGSVVWVQVTAAMTRSSEGKVLRSARIIQDISKRKRAEEALRVSEERLRGLGDNLPNSTVYQYTHEPDGTPRFLYISAGIERINGVKAEDVLKDASVLHRQFFPDELAALMEAEKTSARELSVFEREVQMRLPDGQLRWIHLLSRPRRLPDGRVIWDGVQSDITERKQAEQALQRNEQRLRLAQQIARVGAFDWDIRTGIEKWTPELEALYGLAPGSFAGTQTAFENLIHPDDRTELLRRVEKSLETGAITEGEWRVIWPDGSVHWLAGRWQVTKDESGTPAYMTGCNIDITQRKLAEQALIRSEKLASVGRMAATIAHEVNNPLAGALNAVYLASTDPNVSPSIRDHLAIADQELQRAAHITQQALGFYRENAKPTAVALPKLINEVLTVYAKKLQQRGVTVDTRYNCGPCREGCDTCLIVSSGEMRQVISNLLGNGLDAVRDGGKIYIRASRGTNAQGTGEDIHLLIADNGCGIRAENLKRIFEPFFTTKEAVGTGLGLWITQELVRNHNGTIKVRSRKDKGSVFRISIPVGPNSASQTANPESALTQATSRSN